MTGQSAFLPDWSSPPGETVYDILHEREISFAKFAQEMEWSIDQVERLIIGRLLIESEIAQRLSAILGATTTFWLRREKQYREDLSRETERKNKSWLRHLPVADLKRLGWIPGQADSASLLDQCRQFFDVANWSEWEERYERILQTSVFRTSSTFESRLGATASWLRQGEIEARRLKCVDWSRDKFRAVLVEARSLTRVGDPSKFIPTLRHLCASCGVALVVLRAPTGCRASGASRFVSPNQALLLLSFRYLSDDHFWFSFFHEAGHLVLHSQDSIFVDGDDMMSTVVEEEANRFAATSLIPKQYEGELRTLGSDVRKIIRFARKVGVSRGIVVGQLQYRKLLKPSYLNRLKVRYQWED